MRGLARLALRHALHHRGRTAILVLCLAVAFFLPVTAQGLLARYRTALVARADATPLVAGPRGNRFDLTLGALWFRPSRLEPVPAALVERIAARGDALAVPLSARFTARGYPLVGTSPEYHERRGTRAAAGELPLRIGEAALGAEVARALELGPGDVLHSDPTELYDITKPPALELAVRGVLAPSGTPDDHAVFVDVKTAWILEGLAHGHGEVVAEGAVDEALVLSRAERSVIVSPALLEHGRVTADTLADFHVHGDRGRLPLTAVLVFPRDAKAATLLKSALNVEGQFQVVVPRQVVDDLMAFVLRIKVLFDRVSAVLLASTALFTALVMLLSARLRAEEFRTLHAIGCGRGAVARLYALELSGILLAAAALAALGAGAALRWLPDLVRAL